MHEVLTLEFKRIIFAVVTIDRKDLARAPDHRHHIRQLNSGRLHAGVEILKTGEVEINVHFEED